MKSPKQWIDASGAIVPEKYIPKYTRANERIIDRIFDRYQKMRRALQKTLADTLADIDELQTLRLNDSRAATGKRGNLATRSFDGNRMVEIRQIYDIIIDDRIQTARNMMLDYVREKISKAGSEANAILPIIDEAFRCSNNGSLSQSRILSLLRINITDPQWITAKQLIIDSMTGSLGKSYIRVTHRKNHDSPWQTLTLDIADCTWTKENQ